MSMHSVIILAAGNGSRLKSNTPKILHKIGGLALLDHVIRTSKKIEPDEIIAVLKPEFAVDQLKYGADIVVAHQKKPLGTGHAVQCGLDACENASSEGWMYILYADVPLITAETLQNMLEIAEKSPKTGVVVLAMDSSRSENLGKLASAEENGTIKAIIEAKDAKNYEGNLLPLCNCGILVRKSLLKSLVGQIKPSPVTNEIYITEIVQMAYERNYTCRYYQADSVELSGANTATEMAVLERNFQDMTRRRFLENGVIMTAPETVFFAYDTEIEPDTIIRPYVVFSEGVHVKRGAEIGPFCVIESAEIGNAQVGPFARLRPGAQIKDGARIGNFVEIKNSVISEKTKVNHLTYIGDAFLGKNTNIGAGTITCNYDGVHKHKTTIGDNVFVGSNTALVAPVEVADSTTIGAGSVITANVPKGNLAIARGKQRNIEGWYNRNKKQK